jgi:hypothetical protein
MKFLGKLFNKLFNLEPDHKDTYQCLHCHYRTNSYYGFRHHLTVRHNFTSESAETATKEVLKKYHEKISR